MFTFVPRTRHFAGDEILVDVDNIVACGSVCLTLPTCGAFAWFKNKEPKCKIFKRIYGAMSTPSNGTFYAPLALSSGQRIALLPAPANPTWSDHLQACQAQNLEMLHSPSNSRDVNIIASLGKVALDVQKSKPLPLFQLVISTHDSKHVDLSAFGSGFPAYEFFVYPKCLMVDFFNPYWLDCDSDITGAPNVVCVQP
ncbi:uncharacterized protein LOC125178762 [Hyalella azteca]|uniref:Uncharacterized protein LOC125178762 n=1 Tax=Hyalella azteca TaxID=294128 RepID=A0A979FQ59_HYAAZ|nr:uncharacterized protein LOC125178762 [Hyalella azteca]